MHVIKHQDGGYFFMKPDNKWERTSKLSKATIMPYEKAINVHTNMIAVTFRNKWSVVSYHTEVNGKEEPMLEFDWHSISEAQSKLYSGLRTYSERLNDKLSEVDLEICDIQHYIEFFSLDAAKGYKAYRMLKERLLRRREIKDEMAKVNLFLTGNPSDFPTGKVEKQLCSVENRGYKPRILIEIFGLDDPKAKLSHVS